VLWIILLHNLSSDNFFYFFLKSKKANIFLIKFAYVLPIPIYASNLSNFVPSCGKSIGQQDLYGFVSCIY
jgi:hypothetical protein